MLKSLEMLKQELKVWKNRKRFALRNRDKETIHLANTRIFDIKRMILEKRAN